MKQVYTKELSPGMVTALPVITQMGEVIVSEQTFLTTQIISYLEYYNVPQIFIYEEQDQSSVNEALDTWVTKEEDTYSAQIKRSPEFKKFKRTYHDKVSFFKDSLNDVIKKNEPLSEEQLLNQVGTLYRGHSSSLSVFDMLHNMRQIDDSTYAHSVNVSLISRMLGQWLHFSEKDLEILTIAGLLHDIGKCRIDDAILLKPGKLTQAEFMEIKKHPRLGCEILEKYNLHTNIKYSALMHHERCDGFGYPMGLKLNQINEYAQIVSIADVYDAMTANRCYRKGLCPFEVIATFEREGLEKYNPRFILTFLEHIVDTYMNNSALLNNGKRCQIVFINKKNLSRPMVKLDDGSFIDLSQHPELFIQALI